MFGLGSAEIFLIFVVLVIVVIPVSVAVFLLFLLLNNRRRTEALESRIADLEKKVQK